MADDGREQSALSLLKSVGALLWSMLPWTLAGAMIGCLLTPVVRPPGFTFDHTILGAVIGGVAALALEVSRFGSRSS